MAEPCHGEFDLHGRELHHGDLEAGQGHHNHAARLHDVDGVAGSVEEKLLHGGQFWAPDPDQLAQIASDLDHAVTIRATRIGLDDAAIEHPLASVVDVDYPVAHPGQTRVDAEDPQGALGRKGQFEAGAS